MKKRSELSGSPSAFVFGCGGFGDVDGLLQSAAQVDSPLLDHLPDVFDPVLFVLDTGGLRGDTSAGQTGHIYRNYGWPNSERLLLDPPTQNKALDFKRAIISLPLIAWVIWSVNLCLSHASVYNWLQNDERIPSRGPKLATYYQFICVTEPAWHCSAFVRLRSSAPSIPFFS